MPDGPRLPLWAGRTTALLGIVLVAFTLRQAVAAISPILDAVRVDVPISDLDVGLLGTLPPILFGASGLVAQDLTQKLLRIGLMAQAHSDPHLAVTNAVLLRAKDVAIAITHSGSTGDVIEPLRVAFERGATTVAITGRPGGPDGVRWDVRCPSVGGPGGPQLGCAHD